MANQKSKEGEGPWASISDMMTGLMLVFMFIAVVFLSRVEAKQKEIEDETNKYEQVENAIKRDLKEELKEDLTDWNADILDDGTIRFNDPEVYFKSGSFEIRPKFKKILNDFIPRYLSILSSYKEDIDELQIEGHTSSDWGAEIDLDTRYLKNTELSQQRALSILKYAFLVDSVFDQKDWLVKKLRANGMSFSKPILNKNGNEDKEKSKRVEFKVKLNSDKVLKSIIEKLKN